VIRLFLPLLLAVPLLAASTPLMTLLDAVENRYNRARTLQVSFEESYKAPGRAARTESGELFLRKPGRMRWVYSQPSGKLFLSDGKFIYYYSPSTKTAERMKLKESEDMRAPLAFLLGRLDFDKDFDRFTSRSEGGNLVVVAEPRSDKVPYKLVEFTVTPEHEIRHLVVTGHDNSVLEFKFANERRNPALSENLFRFELPVGAAWVDSAGDSQ
jgi:outer membrane lipoprotein carrier protein